MSGSSEVEAEIKGLIVRALNLKNVDPRDIDSDAPLFNEGLGLDSLDAIQLVRVLEKAYGVTFGPDDATIRAQTFSVSSIAKTLSAGAAS